MALRFRPYSGHLGAGGSDAAMLSAESLIEQSGKMAGALICGVPRVACVRAGRHERAGQHQQRPNV